MAEILRVSGRISNHGFSDYDRLQRGSPSPVPSLDVMPDVGGKALGSWNGNGWSSIQHEVSWVFNGQPSIEPLYFILVLILHLLLITVDSLKRLSAFFLLYCGVYLWVASREMSILVLELICPDEKTDLEQITCTTSKTSTHLIDLCR